jgi:hypothetical protein
MRWYVAPPTLQQPPEGAYQSSVSIFVDAAKLMRSAAAQRRGFFYLYVSMYQCISKKNRD